MSNITIHRHFDTLTCSEVGASFGLFSFGPNVKKGAYSMI